MEFAVSAPFLFGLIVGVVEVSNAVNQYFVLSRIAYEGTRYGTNLSGLESGVYDSAETFTAEMQSRVQSRIRILLDREGFPPTTRILTCRCDGTTVNRCFSPSDSCSTNEVRVRLETQSTPFVFESAGVFPFSFQASGPYLYTTEGS